MLETPSFTKEVRLFGRDLIVKSLNKILLCDITLLDAKDLGSLIQNIAGYPTNYLLTQHERALIRSSVKTYFRALLDA
jgi:hypothetical protein